MKKFIALLGVAVLAGVISPAKASHPTRLCIDAGEDEHSPDSNDDVLDSITVWLGSSDGNHPPQAGCFTDQGGPAGTEINIDFEITANADPDSSDTPESPDMTCTIPADDQMCSVNPPTAKTGDQTTRAWVDEDGDDTTVEADLSEEFDEEKSPGEESEPDFTDVVRWFWHHGPPQCSDGIDNDDDGFTDYPDDSECYNTDDDSENKECAVDACGGYVRYATTVTIHRPDSTNRFSGDLYSRRPCRDDREVIVKKIFPGKDRLIGRGRTRQGVWSTKKPSRIRGRVYAIAKKTRFTNNRGGIVECLRDESPPVTVR